MSKRTPTKLEQQNINYIMEPLIEGNHIFQTIHGSPLSNTQRAALESNQNRGRPAHEGLVPQGVILIIITPPNAIVHTGSTEDTENVRFFSQVDFFKTGMRNQRGQVGWGGNGSITRDNGCWGASRFVPPDQMEIVETIEEKEEKKEAQEKEEKKELKRGPIAGRVKAMHYKEDKSDDDIETSSDDEEDIPSIPNARLRSNGYDDKQTDPQSLSIEEWSLLGDEDEAALFKAYLRTERSDPEQPGFEVLNNIQVFFPGEKFYNQGQEFDEEAASADFDSYYTGPARHDYRWPDSSSNAKGKSVNKLRDEPLPFGQATLEGSTDPDYRVDILKNKKSGNGKKTIKKFNGGLMRTPYFNRKTCGLPYWQPRIGSNVDDNDRVRLVANAVRQSGPTAGGWTTEDLLTIISRNERKIKIVILNSCSPSLIVQQQKAAKRGLDEKDRQQQKQQQKVKSMSDNLSYRNQVYWSGRRNFRMLRFFLPWLGNDTSNPLLPIWSNHSQFTRIDKEDLHYTHIFIGEVFAREIELKKQNEIFQESKQGQQNTNTPTPIQTTLNDKDEVITALGGIYELFPALYTTAALDRRGTLMKQLRDRFQDLFGETMWNIYVESWRNNPDGAPPSVEYLVNQGLIGGKRKRRRRKRKTKRKRRKKTKKHQRRRNKRTRRRKRKN